jgi:hypothetical protein
MEVDGQSGWGRRLLAGEMRKSEGENGGWWTERMGKTKAEKDPSDFFLRPDVRAGALPFFKKRL